MLKRCEDPEDHAYKHYGGRGIQVCNEWHDYNNFKKWYLDQGFDVFGNDKRTTDRIDVDGNYCPENCRLANISTQANNKRNTRYVEHCGKRYSARDIVNLYPWLSFNTVRSRIYRELSWEEVVKPSKKIKPITASKGNITIIFQNKRDAGKKLGIDSSYINKCMQEDKPGKGWRFECFEEDSEKKLVTETKL